MNRPKDIDGDDIVMGPWYWAQNRRGDVIGVGKFAVLIGHNEITFFVNGIGYSPDSFAYRKNIDTNPDREFKREARKEQPHD